MAAKIVIIFGFAIRPMIFLSPWYASLCLYCLSGFALGDELADDFYAGDEEEADEGEKDRLSVEHASSRFTLCYGLGVTPWPDLDE